MIEKSIINMNMFSAIKFKLSNISLGYPISH